MFCDPLIHHNVPILWLFTKKSKLLCCIVFIRNHCGFKYEKRLEKTHLFQHLQLLGSLPKTNQASSEKNTDTLYGAAEAQTKQNPLVSLWSKNKWHGAWEGKQTLLYLASPHKLSRSPCWFWMCSRRSSYPGNQTFPITHIQKGEQGRLQGTNVIVIVWYPILQHKSVRKSPIYISCDESSGIWEDCKYFHSSVFTCSTVATLAAWLCGCWPTILDQALYLINGWMDYHNILYRCSRSPEDPLCCLWWSNDFSFSTNRRSHFLLIKWISTVFVLTLMFLYKSSTGLKKIWFQHLKQCQQIKRIFFFHFMANQLISYSGKTRESRSEKSGGLRVNSTLYKFL